jgi:hypothetical protein
MKSSKHKKRSTDREATHLERVEGDVGKDISIPQIPTEIEIHSSTICRLKKKKKKERKKKKRKKENNEKR